MKSWKLRKLTRVHWSLLGLALLGAALLLTSQAGRLRHYAAALSVALLPKSNIASGQSWTAYIHSQPFTVRSYGGKCLEFGPPRPLPHQAILGNPVFISDCNGTAAQQVRVQEVNDQHEVILWMGSGVIGRNEIPVVILEPGFSAQAGAVQASSAAANSTSAADQIPLEVQSYTGSEGQKFALDGDSIILAADRNLVVEVQNNRGANGTPLVLGRRDLEDAEFWTFSATDGSDGKLTTGFVRVALQGDPQALADRFANLVQTAQPGTVVEMDPDVSIDLTDLTNGLPLHVPAGVTIRGDRRGARTGPELGVREGFSGAMLEISGDDVRVTGLRLRGPTDSADGDVPEAKGIFVSDHFLRAIIDHNEISKWSSTAVAVQADQDSDMGSNCLPSSNSRPHDVLIARNFIHQNESQNLGYGVGSFAGAYPLIEGNTFVSNRHAIAADGIPPTGYRARYNLVLSYAPYQYKIGLPWWHTHDFDAHGAGDNGFGGRAGQYFEIARNTFLATDRKNFNLRGEPCFLAEFHHNVSLRHLTLDTSGLYPAVVCSSSDCGGKLKVYDNQFGAANPTGRLGVGDFDGDGKDDLFLATGAAWYYAPAGIAEWRFLNAQTDVIGSLLFGDFDGDGRMDVFTQHGRDWDVSWGGASQWEKINESNPALSDFAVGNFDSDNRADVFYTSGREWFFSSGGVGPLTVLDASGYRVSDLRFGDFDGDGKTDVFSVGNHWQVSYGATSGWQPLPHKLTGSVAGLIVADFNGDRRADVATAGINPLGSLVWKVSYSGVGDWTQTPLPRNSVAAIGRFDGSGGADLLLWNDNFLEIDPGGSGASHSHSRQDMR